MKNLKNSEQKEKLIVEGVKRTVKKTVKEGTVKKIKKVVVKETRSQHEYEYAAYVKDGKVIHAEVKDTWRGLKGDKHEVTYHEIIAKNGKVYVETSPGSYYIVPVRIIYEFQQRGIDLTTGEATEDSDDGGETPPSVEEPTAEYLPADRRGSQTPARKVRRPDGLVVFLDDDEELNQIRLHGTPEEVIRAVAIRRAKDVAKSYIRKYAPHLVIKNRQALPGANKPVFYSFTYQDRTARRLIRKMKYKNSIEATQELAVLSGPTIVKLHEVYNFDAILVVPSRTNWTLSLFGEYISQLLNIPVISCINLAKEKTSQCKLKHYYQRYNNVKGAFTLDEFRAAQFQNKYKKILVIDNVRTSGATLKEIDRILTEAGFETVLYAIVSANKTQNNN